MRLSNNSTEQTGKSSQPTPATSQKIDLVPERIQTTQKDSQQHIRIKRASITDDNTKGRARPLPIGVQPNVYQHKFVEISGLERFNGRVDLSSTTIELGTGYDCQRLTQHE